MISNLFRVGLCALVLIGSQAAVADQKIKTKSNIKNDRVPASSSAACTDEKEGSADGKVACKTVDVKSSANLESSAGLKSSASSVASTQNAEPTKP